MFLWTLLLAEQHPGIDHVALTSDIDLSSLLPAGSRASLLRRPPHLCQDEVSAAEVAIETAKTYELAPEDLLLLLQPTSPFRTEAQVTSAISIVKSGAAPGVVTVRTLGSPLRALRFLDLTSNSLSSPIFPDHNSRCSPPRLITGSIYAGSWKSLNGKSSFQVDRYAPLETDPISGLDIDTIDDLNLARNIVASGLVRRPIP